MRPRAMSRGWRPVLVLGALSVTLFALVRAAEWTVDDDGPADFPKIQQAIQAFYVAPGDTILVRPGVYYENIFLLSKDLILRSEEGPFVTVIDGSDSGSVVMLQDRTSATRIEGFTIRNGRDQTGGGVWIYGGGPVITRNIIEGNSAVGGLYGYGYGGGIEIYGSAAVLTRNVIRGNTAVDGGGGIDVYYAGPGTAGTCCPVIEHNTIADNAVTAPAGIGGGILSFASEPMVSASIIEGNQAASGGGFYSVRPHGTSDEMDAAYNILFANLPDNADSDGNWRLPASNRIVDPRLGEGNWLNLWPRSDSPALETAPNAAAGPDLSGHPSPQDSDLDGTQAFDVGALENRQEITGLRLAHESSIPEVAVLTWDGSINPAVTFNVYASDFDPFVSDGGFCLASALAVTTLTDSFLPAPGQVRYYVVTGMGVAEGSRGFTSAGVPLPSSPSCQVP